MCSGTDFEEVSYWLWRRFAQGDAPDTLVDFMSANSGAGGGEWLLIVDESHVTVPQIGGMSSADKARKQARVFQKYSL